LQQIVRYERDGGRLYNPRQDVSHGSKIESQTEGEDQEEGSSQIKGGSESKSFKETVVKTKREIEANKKEINDENGCKKSCNQVRDKDRRKSISCHGNFKLRKNIGEASFHGEAIADHNREACTKSAG
jgi:hypothetical protein